MFSLRYSSKNDVSGLAVSSEDEEFWKAQRKKL